jgi:peptidoglycan/xylan/chitin deacetylase (PgdA/CDA1 family)
VIFKDDDVGKDFEGLKKWIDVVLENDAKATIGLIGKYMKNQELRDFLGTLDEDRIEIFCHGYSHSRLSFLIMKKIGRNRIYPTEFDRSFGSHYSSLKKYRKAECKYLDRKAIAFGPQGNIWNESVIDALVKNDFKLIFSWEKIKHDLLTIPLSGNFRQDSLDDFISVYKKNKEYPIYTLQFHHANLSERQFELMKEVIEFLKNNEGRIFITPSELLKISKKDKNIFDLMAPENVR